MSDELTNFEFAVTHILLVEGGFSDHPADRGGPTKFGITQHTLNAYHARVPSFPIEDANKSSVPAPLVKADDVRDLTRPEAVEIYRVLFWQGLDVIKDKMVAAILLDQIVHRGPKSALRTAQETANGLYTMEEPLKLDGILGLKTAERINAIEPRIFALRFVRSTHYAYVKIVRKNPSDMVFLSGWLARTWTLLDLIFFPDKPMPRIALK